MFDCKGEIESAMFAWRGKWQLPGNIVEMNFKQSECIFKKFNGLKNLKNEY